MLWRQGFFQTPIGGLNLLQQTCNIPKPQTPNGVPAGPAPPVILLHPRPKLKILENSLGGGERKSLETIDRRQIER
jgi:hypothetical protein